jgi:hypothetical protein
LKRKENLAKSNSFQHNQRITSRSGVMDFGVAMSHLDVSMIIHLKTVGIFSNSSQSQFLDTMFSHKRKS